MMYTVGEIGEILGINASALRFYDRNGLLPFVERSPGGIRLIAEENLEDIQELIFLRECGFTVKDLSAYMTLPPASPERAQMIRHRIGEIQEEIRERKTSIERLEGMLG